VVLQPVAAEAEVVLEVQASQEHLILMVVAELEFVQPLQVKKFFMLVAVAVELKAQENPVG
jgi:hypothetical protein